MYQFFSQSKRLYLVLMWAVALLTLVGCEQRMVIVNNLDEREANEIIVFLATKGIVAQKVAQAEGGPGGGGGEVLWNLAVDSSSATEAMALLNVNGLPKRRGKNLLDIFSGGGLVSSEQEEKIRYQSGLDAQIANTIRKIDGILDADVLISYPIEDELNPTVEEKKFVTASIYVKHQGVLDDPNNHLVPKIKRLVASSINGLEFDNVTVIADRSRFADLSLQAFSARRSSEDQLVRLWTVTLAQSSVTRFRVIFFSLISLLILAFGFVGFFLFKLSKLLAHPDGIKILMEPKPIEFPQLGEKKVEKVEEEDEEEEAAEETSEEETEEVEEAEEEEEEES